MKNKTAHKKAAAPVLHVDESVSLEEQIAQRATRELTRGLRSGGMADRIIA